ncbi:hypothetical protein LOTGIDRAFT_133861 [Lottia gigantea]|uniref:Palmitoyltransferase n=1 Tax=Lottia gigantea TaxID=225164 RepID=V3ZQQ1_LOTGI|nr:hypothetical protein LOTGIDRAFT_133861 [Lottia gigantea]ESO83216.1 hypothetical protein LOTGIDRAFT_133861 [Lottia gigantea]
MKCNLQVPPRAHHCNICQSCILKRHHHCYLVGKCIGFKNQRYFIVLAFYSVIVSFWGLYLTVVYLRDKWWHTATWSDAILPMTILRCLFGNITAHVTILVFHCYMWAMFGPIAMVYFISQILLIFKGLTLYELAKNVPVRNTASVSKNFQSVFGDFWALNFIIPAQILFRQKEDGCSWNSVKIIQNPPKDVHHHCQIL